MKLAKIDFAHDGVNFLKDSEVPDSIAEQFGRLVYEAEKAKVIAPEKKEGIKLNVTEKVKRK